MVVVVVGERRERVGKEEGGKEMSRIHPVTETCNGRLYLQSVRVQNVDIIVLSVEYNQRLRILGSQERLEKTTHNKMLGLHVQHYTMHVECMKKCM